jgi:hypothetical protein
LPKPAIPQSANHFRFALIPDVARVIAPLWKRTINVQEDEFNQSSAAIDGQVLAEFMNGDAAGGLTADAVGAAPVTRMRPYP